MDEIMKALSENPTAKKAFRNLTSEEKIDLLENHDYRGFVIKSMKRTWEGVEVFVEDKRGIILSSFGETDEEVFENIIDQIDNIKG